VVDRPHILIYFLARSRKMESMPFFHADQIFNIVFEQDLAFSEVRAILDYLLDSNAFSLEAQECEGHYMIDVEDAAFQVWVSEMNVIIEKQ
jgi:hypothetical protein